MMRGHVRKRGTKWAIVFDFGVSLEGKRKQKWVSGFSTKKEAESALTKALTDVNNGEYTSPSTQTVNEFFHNWAIDKQAQVRQSTWRSYKWTIDYHILPNIGKLTLKDLKPETVQKMYSKIRNQTRQDGKSDTLSERSILHVHLILKNALDRAVRWGLISRNPCDLVEAPRPRKVEMTIWTMDQVRQFLKESEREPQYIVFLLLLTTGMRIGEVLGLRWRDILFEERKITVRQQISFVKGGYVVQEPKTRASKRSIPIPNEVIQALIKHKLSQDIRKNFFGEEYAMQADLVCCTDKGTPYYHGNLNAKWAKIIQRAGLTRIRIHDARHTHASLLLQQGANPKIVQERLGHANIGITLDTYTHLLPGIQEQAIDEFAKRFFK